MLLAVHAAFETPLVQVGDQLLEQLGPGADRPCDFIGDFLDLDERNIHGLACLVGAVVTGSAPMTLSTDSYFGRILLAVERELDCLETLLDTVPRLLPGHLNFSW